MTASIASIVTGFSLKSSCCGADVYTRTDGLGRAFECCAKCDTLIPRSEARLPARPSTADARGDPLPMRVSIPPRRPAPAEPPSSEPSMAKTFAPRHCLTCDKKFTPRGPTHRFCSDACKAGDPSPSAKPKKAAAAPAPKTPRNTGFKSAPPTGGDNAYQPTIDALREELDGLEDRRQKLTDAITHLEQLGATGG